MGGPARRTGIEFRHLFRHRLEPAPRQSHGADPEPTPREVRAQARTIAVDDLPVLELDGQLFPFKEPRLLSGVDTIIDEQHYRPAYWRLSRHEGNYRRFFDIDGLIGVRVEDPDVFERTHELIADLCGDEQSRRRPGRPRRRAD